MRYAVTPSPTLDLKLLKPSCRTPSTVVLGHPIDIGSRVGTIEFSHVHKVQLQIDSELEIV